MVKIHELEISSVVDAVRNLLKHVPNIRIVRVHDKKHLDSDYRIDVRIDFDYAGIRHALLLDIKPYGAPRFARSAVYQLESYIAKLQLSVGADVTRQFIPMLISSYLSPESRTICLDHNVAYLDLYGNVHFTFGNVYIERTVPDKPKAETRALRPLFTPRAGAILRALLHDPARAWRVSDLAESANASLGHVSNIRKALLDREWIEIHNDGLVLVRPGALLKSWRENYRRPTGEHISAYTVFDGDQLHSSLAGKLNPGPQSPRAIYAMNSAAQWFAPYVRDVAHSFYADEQGLEVLKETLRLTRIAQGAKVNVHTLNDETLFEDSNQPVPGIFCTNQVATYLDLYNGNYRDREAADYLSEKCFSWR